MKRILFITSIAFLLSSCAVKFPYKQYSTYVDFTEFTNDGFFITESNSVSFDYAALGSVRSVVESGHEILNPDKAPADNDHVYTMTDLGKLKMGGYISATPEQALSEIVAASKTIGANGIINLNVQFIAGSVSNSYVITGMAIKLK